MHLYYSFYGRIILCLNSIYIFFLVFISFIIYVTKIPSLMFLLPHMLNFQVRKYIIIINNLLECFCLWFLSFNRHFVINVQVLSLNKQSNHIFKFEFYVFCEILVINYHQLILTKVGFDLVYTWNNFSYTWLFLIQS